MRQLHYRKQLTDALHNLTDIKRDLTLDRQSADELEFYIAKANRDVESRLAHNDTVRIREIRAALQRLDDGTLGECVGCDGRIAPKRLDAAPWAARCVKCQEEFEARSEPVDYLEAA
jgi:RNA polymerase-binding transcription factor DksA